MENIAKYIIYVGIALIIIGAVLYGTAKLNLPLGRMPGDIRIEGEHGTFYFPLTTSIIASIVLTILFNLLGRILKK